MKVIYFLEAMNAKIWGGAVVINDIMYYTDSGTDMKQLKKMFKKWKKENL